MLFIKPTNRPILKLTHQLILFPSVLCYKLIYGCIDVYSMMHYHDGCFVFPMLRRPVEHSTILGKLQYSWAVAKTLPPAPAPHLPLRAGIGRSWTITLPSWLSYIFNKLVQTNHQPILAETFKITTWDRVLAKNLRLMHCFKWHLRETLGGFLNGTLSLKEKKIIK